MMKTVGDLVEDLKKRAILVLLWVAGLSYLMSLTSNSFWVNVPVALLIIAALRSISGSIEIRWRSSRPFSSIFWYPPPSSRFKHRVRQVPAKDLITQPPSAYESWRRGVDAPEVEAALCELTKSVVSEWVTGLWYSSISSDQEFPDQLTALINGVLAQIAFRAKRVNLINLLTQDVVDLIASHLDLFRKTQARVGADVLGSLSAEERDENLKQVLAASGELHPALLSPESESRVLHELMGGLVSVVLKPSDGNCGVLRSLARELLACAVLRPVMSMACPAFINMQIENVAIASVTSAPKSEGNLKSTRQSSEPPVWKEPSEPGLEMMQVIPFKEQGEVWRGGPVEAHGKGAGEVKSVSGSPIVLEEGHSLHAGQEESAVRKLDAFKSHNEGEHWAQVLEVVNDRKTRALAPEHLDNLWTKGRNYKKRELNKSTVKPKETNVTKDQLVSHPLVMELPIPQAKPKREEGKSTELVELRPSCSMDPNADLSVSNADQDQLNASNVPSTDFALTGLRRSRSTGAELDGWQALEKQEGSIPSLLKAGEGKRKSDLDSSTRGIPRSFMDPDAGNGPLSSHPSWKNQLKVNVMGAHFEKVSTKTFAVYSIIVSDGQNRTWDVQRRYRNFEQLHRSLKDKPYYCLCLPAKRFLSSNLDNNFIRKRCLLLDKYLKDLLSIPSIAELHEVWDFLSANSQNYAFGESPSMLKTLASNVDDAVDDMLRQFRAVADINQEKLKIANSESRQRANINSGALAINAPPTNHSQILTQTSGSTSGTRPAALEKKVGTQQMLWEDNHFDMVHDDVPHGLGIGWLPDHDLQRRERLGGSPFGSDHGLVEPHKDGRSNFEGSKMFDGKQERSLSEGHSPVGSLAGSDMAEDDNLAIPHDWGPPKVSVPLLNLVDGIFELQGRGWIRRQVFWMAKQVLQLFMGDAIDDFLLGKIQILRKEEVVAGGIRWLHTILWPDGVFLTKHPSRQQDIDSGNSGGRGETFEQRLEAARRAGVVREIILDRAPAGLVSLIGSKQYKRCATDIFFFLQSAVCLKQLAFSLLEMLLLSAFPELHDLILNVRNT